VTEPLSWRCFHCDEVFTTADAAAEHFGPRIYSDPACTVDASRLRALESELDAYRQEDTELHRAMWGMQSRHATELVREEETGYARGLRDGVNLPLDSPERAACVMEVSRG
jgi:hypothetical protein